MTTAQFASLTSVQLDAFTTAQIAAIETADLHAISTAALSTLTTAQIDAFTTDQIHALSTTQIASLTTAEVVAMTSDQFDALTTTQFVALTSAHMAALTTAEIAHFNTADIAAMTTLQMHALTTADIAAFTTDQVVALSTMDLAALTTAQVAAFTTDEIAVMSGTQLDALISASPIVLDLNGNGVQTTTAAHGNAFDLNATGHGTQHGWVSSTDGLLVIDRNHNGQIDNGTELFGTATMVNGHRAGNGFSAMNALDSNHDGKLDMHDAAWKDLRVWVDANGDGKVEAGEMKTLDQLHIASLDLHANAGTNVNNGNLLGLTSSFTTTDGAKHDMADVWFTKDPGNATPTSSGTTGSSGSSGTVHGAPGEAGHGTATPHLSDLLAGPTTDVLPAHLAHMGIAPAGGEAGMHPVIATHVMPHHADDEELRRHGGPLI
jgi:hypothetical protein